MADHSPLPWFNDGYRIYGATTADDKREGHMIAEYKHVTDAKAEDYQLIVRAVNCHQELVDALKALLALTPQGTITTSYGVDLAKAALAKAGQKD